MTTILGCYGYNCLSRSKLVGKLMNRGHTLSSRMFLVAYNRSIRFFCRIFCSIFCRYFRPRAWTTCIDFVLVDILTILPCIFLDSSHRRSSTWEQHYTDKSYKDRSATWRHPSLRTNLLNISLYILAFVWLFNKVQVLNLVLNL